METSLPAPQWRVFIRALAEEVDSLAGPDERDDMLRGIGRRMSALMPLPPVETLEALELEMNDLLAAVGWGAVRLEVDEAEPALRILHTGLPRVGSLGSPPGQWLAPVLPGLFDGWFAQQPGAQPTLHTHTAGIPGADAVTLLYAKG